MAMTDTNDYEKLGVFYLGRHRQNSSDRFRRGFHSRYLQ
jgi:hypothetical protein